MKRAGWIAMFVALAACDGPIEPVGELEWGDFTLPPADTILDPSRLRPGEIIATHCSLPPTAGGLEQFRGVHEWTVVDVFLGREDAEGAWGPPTSEDLANVAAGGGHVLHLFNVPAVRVRIVMSRLPELVLELRNAQAPPVIREVPDLRRFDYEVSVGYDSHADEYVALFESLGGRVERRIDELGMLSGVIPDRSVPALREDPGVVWVKTPGMGCLA